MVPHYYVVIGAGFRTTLGDLLGKTYQLDKLNYVNNKLKKLEVANGIKVHYDRTWSGDYYYESEVFVTGPNYIIREGLHSSDGGYQEFDLNFVCEKLVEIKNFAAGRELKLATFTYEGIEPDD